MNNPTGFREEAGFWERRARRILPAMVFVVAATLVAGWFLLLPSDFSLLGKSVVAQGVFGSNIWFWLNSGYFAPAAEEMPLLHTWSLAVEEQFYLVVPFLLAGLFRVPALRGRARLLQLVGLGIVLSFAASLYGVAHHPSATFYLLPSRAWELLLGVLVALLPRPGLALWCRELLCWTALLLILVPCFLYTRATPFPGLAALPPCLGTAVVIWASAGLARADAASGGHAPGASVRLLAWRPLVFIGLISYPLYLIHWPFVAFTSYLALGPVSVQHRIGLVVVSSALAVLVWRFVESPFRTRRVCAGRRSLFGLGASALAALVVAGVVVVRGAGFPDRLSPEAAGYAAAATANDFNQPTSLEDVARGRFIDLGRADQSDPPRWAVWGDSHAIAAMPAFHDLLVRRGERGLGAAAYRTAPLLDFDTHAHRSINRNIRPLNDAILAQILAQKVSGVFLVARWDLYSDAFGPAALRGELVRTVGKLTAAGLRVWVVMDAPCHPHNVPKKLAIAAMSGRDPGPLALAATDYRSPFGEDERGALREIEAAGAEILDPRAGMLDPTGEVYKVQVGGHSLYCDADHLSSFGAGLLLEPLIETALARSGSGKAASQGDEIRESHVTE